MLYIAGGSGLSVVFLAFPFCGAVRPVLRMLANVGGAGEAVGSVDVGT